MTANAGAVQQARRDAVGSQAFERGGLQIAAQYESLVGMYVPDLLTATSGLQRAINALRGREISWQQPVVPRATERPVDVNIETIYTPRSGWIVGAIVSPNIDHGVVALVEVGSAPDVITGEYIHLPNMYDITVSPAPEAA
jgi:hypothetical protein